MFTLVLIGTYVGIGALAHDYGFSLAWIMVSTVLVWAGPAQVIMISALGTGAALFETAVAVGFSRRAVPADGGGAAAAAARRRRRARAICPAGAFHRRQHVGGVVPAAAAAAARAARRRSATGSAIGFMLAGHIGSVIGFYLAASLPALLTAALLFLTPMSFLVSTARNSSTLVDRLALAFGLVVSPLLVYSQVGLDLMWTGLIAGSRGLCGPSPARGAAMSERAVALSGADPGRLPAERGLAAARRRGGARPRRGIRADHLGAGGRDRGAGRRDRQARCSSRPARSRDVPLAVRLGRDRAAACWRSWLVAALGFAGVAVGEAGAARSAATGSALAERRTLRRQAELLHPELIHADEGHRVLGLERVPLVEIGHGRSSGKRAR